MSTSVQNKKECGCLSLKLCYCYKSFGDMIFDKKDLSGYSLTYTKMTGINFNNFDFMDADFTNADLSGSTFVNADLRDSLFNETTVTDTDFDNASADTACFIKVDLRDVRLMGVSFVAAKLISCNLENN
ncbi:MAG: pentapeptide repeat-containing protein, partial [Psychrobacter sp.]|nr:pentapeptide repeat-containing protein [Psychrobacter sp.]